MPKQKQAHGLWEVSLIALRDNGNTHFKVTRRVSQLSVAETKMFFSEAEAKEQFDAWLQ